MQPGAVLSRPKRRQLLFHLFLYPRSSLTSPGAGSGAPHTRPRQAWRFEMSNHSRGLWQALILTRKVPASSSAKHHCAPEVRKGWVLPSVHQFSAVGRCCKTFWAQACLDLESLEVFGTPWFSQRKMERVFFCRAIQNYCFCGQSVSENQKDLSRFSLSEVMKHWDSLGKAPDLTMTRFPSWWLHQICANPHEHLALWMLIWRKIKSHIIRNPLFQ